MLQYVLVPILLLTYSTYAAQTQATCPTIGTTASILVTTTPELDLSGFINLLQYYGRLMPVDEQISYFFTFGYGTDCTLTTDTSNLEDQINNWIEDSAYIQQLCSCSSKSTTNEQLQYDSPDIVTVIKNIFGTINYQNQRVDKVILKKQVVLITDYVPMNVTDIMNTDTNYNVQRLGLTHSLNVSLFDDAANFPVFSVDQDSHIGKLRAEFQESLPFQFPSVREDKAKSDNLVYLTEMDSNALKQIAAQTELGSLCSLGSTTMYSSFLHVHFAYADNVTDLTFPWLGNTTQYFINTCIDKLVLPPRNVSEGCTPQAQQVIESFVNKVETQINRTFVTLVVSDMSCATKPLLGISSDLSPVVHMRIVTDNSMDDIYESLIYPMELSGVISNNFENQIIPNTNMYLRNFSTTCVTDMPFVTLLHATQYHKPKYLHIALDDMLWITICATISVTTFGVLIYQHVKRTQKKNMELLTEIMLQPRVFRAAKESSEVMRLPWEVKAERVHIDREFMLGEGTVSNVYLGKLKGKAPIMQWIDRVEMKQYQDCAVAVRVPKHFDEPEEDQLTREIASMRRLRHHDQIALLLGWTNKDSLVCSLLELTHMNMIKYLGQIKETMINLSENNFVSTKYIPYQVMYKVVWEICDGMAYIHSRNLIHRDLTARNILLTTGLRAKISGFGFCSEPDDPKFSSNAQAMRFLPVRWMAPEAFQGKSVLNSDVWSFAVLLYEVFTLGDIPYEDLMKPEDIVETVRKGRIPAMPKFASKNTYAVMQRCFHQFPERRPKFNQLKDIFHTEMETVYENAAFRDDDDF